MLSHKWFFAAAQCAHAAVGVVEHVRKHNQLLLRQWEEYGAAKVAVKCPKQAEMVRHCCIFILF